MIVKISKSQKDCRNYKKLLLLICMIIVLVLSAFSIYSVNYHNTKHRIENKFKTALKENGFTKNKNGLYSYEYDERTTFILPNQQMPELLDFSLNFHNSNVYCNIKNEDKTYIEGIWMDNNDYTFTLYSSDRDIIYSSESLKKDENNISKLSEKLNIDETYLKEIIEKGNKLYKQFYE